MLRDDKMPASSPPAQRSNGKPAPLSRESEKTEWRGVVYACAATALSDLTFGMIAPFFPNAALSRGVSQSVVGAIFAVQALGVCVGSLLAPTYALERLGAFGALRLATLAQALFTAAFCLVDRMSTAVPFAAACLTVRLLQGLACGLTETAAASLAMRSVPDRLLGDVFAWVAAARALGAVSGPPVGGAAFDWRGFAAPFTIAGGLLGALGLLMLVAGVRAGSAGGAGGPPSTGMASLLRVPGVVPALLSMHTALAALNFLMPTLQPFFHTAFALSSTQIGLAFLGVAVAYGAAIGASGPLSRAAGEAPQMVLGLALIALGYLLLGPSPILARWLPQTLAGSLGALAVGAAGMAMAMVPSTPLMIAAVSAWAAGDADRKQRAIDGLAALATVAGSLGGVTGPALGGVLMQYLSFPGATSCFAALPVALVPLLLPYIHLRAAGAAQEEVIASRRRSSTTGGLGGSGVLL